MRFLLMTVLAFVGCSDKSEDSGTVAASCGTHSMRLFEADSFSPSVVRVSFELSCGDEPIIGMTEEDFTIYEDGDPISIFESAQKIVPNTASYDLSTILDI